MPGQLAAKIRAKYPGAYDDLDDSDLEAQVLSKHPEYHDLVEPAAQQREYPTTAGFLKNAAKGAVRQVQGAADLAQTYQTQGLLGVAPKIVEGLKGLPARAKQWYDDPLQTIQDDPTAAALDVSSVVGGVAAAPRFLRGVSGLRAPIGRGIVATGQAAQDLAASIPGKSAGVAGAIYEGMHGRPINAVGALAVPKAIEYGGELTKMLGRKIQGPSPKPPPSLIERYAPNVSGYETPSPASVGRGFDPANPPVFDPRVGGIMEGEVAPVGSRVTHPTPSVLPNMSRGATTPQVLPESWGKLTDAFTGTNAQLNAKLVKARILMKTQPELSLEQAMKAVAKQ